MDQKKIGQFIQHLRKSNGYTQKSLGELLGVSDKTVSKWELGNSLPDISLILKLCSHFDISVNELLSGERLQADSYSQRADDTILSLLSENKKIKRREQFMIVLTILFLIFVLFFITLTDFGVSAILNGALNIYWDFAILLSVLLLLGSFVFLCGIKGAKILHTARSFALPCGVLVSLFHLIGILFQPGDPDIMLISCGISLLPVFYAMIIYLVVSAVMERRAH